MKILEDEGFKTLAADDAGLISSLNLVDMAAIPYSLLLYNESRGLHL
jgi:hypothetical protein